MTAAEDRGEQLAGSVLSLNSGAGPTNLEGPPMHSSADPARPAGYWDRVRRIVDQAPPLTNDQRARIRAAFHQPAERAAA